MGLKDEDVRQAALRHEAAHVVVAVQRGRSVFSVRVEESRSRFGAQYLGLTEFSDPLERVGEPDFSSDPDNGMVISFAGPEAERRFLLGCGYPEREVRRMVDEFARGDYGVVDEYRRYARLSERRARELAVEEVGRYWAEIERVAVAVDAAGGVLKGAALRDVVGVAA